MKIVIVEDDPGIRKELKQLLENAFYEAAAKVRMLERKIAQAEEKNTVLYEDYVGGIVEKEDFDMMKELSLIHI